MLRFTLPLPPKELSPNWRGHWAKKAKAVKGYRHLADVQAFVLCRRLDIIPFRLATIQATFYFTDHRVHDRDNCLSSLKAAFDGLCDGGLILNDSGLTHLPVVLAIDKLNPRVVLEVTKTD